MFRMNLQQMYFDQIVSGVKTYELRLYDEKRRLLNINDIIEFYTDGGDIVQAQVINLVKANNFETLLAKIDIKATGFMCSTDAESVLLKYYPLEKQSTYGVVAIQLKVLK